MDKKAGILSSTVEKVDKFGGFSGRRGGGGDWPDGEVLSFFGYGGRDLLAIFATLWNIL